MQKNEKIEIANKLKKQAIQSILGISDYLRGNFTLGFMINNKKFCGLDLASIDKCVTEISNNGEEYFSISAGRMDDTAYSCDSDMLNFRFKDWLE